MIAHSKKKGYFGGLPFSPHVTFFCVPSQLENASKERDKNEIKISDCFSHIATSYSVKSGARMMNDSGENYSGIP